MEKYNFLYKWILKPEEVTAENLKENLGVLWALEEIKKTDNEKRILELVKEYRLPMEYIPTEKQTKKVYELMLDNFGITALIRNLGKLTQLGIIKDGAYDEINKVCDRITNKEALIKGRVHPISILFAMNVYRSGQGFKGSLSWNPVTKVVDALDDAFYESFHSIEPTGLRYTIGLDVSGSMGGARIIGTNITAREASAAMCMVTARTEKNHTMMAFSRNFMPVPFSSKDKLDRVISSVSRMDFDSTDCSLPMSWALKNKVPTDVFIVYTDSETNAYGQPQPITTLRQYREQMGIPAKLVVVGMVSNGFTLADPDDAGMLDVVGFDTAAPDIIREFALGNV